MTTGATAQGPGPEVRHGRQRGDERPHGVLGLVVLPGVVASGDQEAQVDLGLAPHELDGAVLDAMPDGQQLLRPGQQRLWRHPRCDPVDVDGDPVGGHQAPPASGSHPVCRAHSSSRAWMPSNHGSLASA